MKRMNALRKRGFGGRLKDITVENLKVLPAALAGGVALHKFTGMHPALAGGAAVTVGSSYAARQAYKKMLAADNLRIHPEYMKELEGYLQERQQ